MCSVGCVQREVCAVKRNKLIIVMGDINCDVLAPDPTTNHLLSIMGEQQLTHLITEPTRITAKFQTLIIDHCYVSSPCSLKFPLEHQGYL